ncbi:MAG TPA: TIGR00730 family Rossman fold protein [Allosphingosinicella sp.]
MRICVYTGSRHGSRPEYEAAARNFGTLLASEGIGLVYGGGHLGLMGVIADAALAAGGEVVGVIPQKLVEWEVAHTGLTELHVVHSMHERKQMMADLADAFVALPGGIGTMEELFEVWAWLHLGYHDKPCALLDVAGFYAPLVAFLDRMVDEGFLKRGTREMLLTDTDSRALLEQLRAFRAPATLPILDRDEL